MKRAKKKTTARHCLFIIFPFGCRLFKTIYKIKRIMYTNVHKCFGHWSYNTSKMFANICPLYLWPRHLPVVHVVSVNCYIFLQMNCHRNLNRFCFRFYWKAAQFDSKGVQFWIFISNVWALFSFHCYFYSIESFF